MTYLEKYLTMHRRFRKMTTVTAIDANVINPKDIVTCWELPVHTKWLGSAEFNKFISKSLANDTAIFLKSYYDITCHALDIQELTVGVKEAKYWAALTHVLNNHGVVKDFVTLQKDWENWFHTTKIEK